MPDFNKGDKTQQGMSDNGWVWGQLEFNHKRDVFVAVTSDEEEEGLSGVYINVHDDLNNLDYTLGGSDLPVGESVIGGVIPSGTIEITENGTGIDVAQYALADVNVSGGGASLIEVASDENITMELDDGMYIGISENFTSTDWLKYRGLPLHITVNGTEYDVEPELQYRDSYPISENLAVFFDQNGAMSVASTTDLSPLSLKIESYVEMCMNNIVLVNGDCYYCTYVQGIINRKVLTNAGTYNLILPMINGIAYFAFDGVSIGAITACSGDTITKDNDTGTFTITGDGNTITVALPPV